MSRLEYDSELVPGLIQDVSIFHILPSSFCRCNIDDNLVNLSNSIQQKGLLQPILVRVKGDHLEIVAGNRRYNACRSLGWRKITCYIVELDDREAFEVSLIENIQRKSLNPIEEAQAFKKYVTDFGWGGITDLAIKIGRSASYVTKRIGLLDLPPNVIDSILNSEIPISVAEEINSIRGNTNTQKELACMILDKHLSLRKTRMYIKAASGHDNMTVPDDFAYISTCDKDHEKVQKSFDKSIVALRVAMMRLGEVINNIQENWMPCEFLMQHKRMLNAQIDILIKEKIKLNRRL
jgi:ParB family chromosome partitioning protein